VISTSYEGGLARKKEHIEIRRLSAKDARKFKD